MIFIFLIIALSVHVLSYWYDVREFKKELKRREMYFKRYHRKLIIKSKIK
jgi:hypothetical protein